VAQLVTLDQIYFLLIPNYQLLSLTSMQNEPRDTRIPVMMPRSLVERIDAWRREQEDLPSRAEAIRRLVERGLSLSETGL
jgi:hypothetical protein